MVPKSPIVLGILCVVVLVSSIIGINFFEDFSSFMEISPAKYQIIADSNTLYEINKKGFHHKENQNQQEFDLQMKLMKERQEVIASTIFGYEVIAIVDEYNFPYVDTVEIREDLEPFDICAIPEKIPTHLEKISQDEIFELFAKKYSNHHVQAIIQDERRDMSNIHYQFTATSNQNEDLTATLMYHIDSCTDENNSPISLNCFDHKNKQNSHSRFADNLIDSLNDDGNFCMIPFEDWQQGLLDYNKEISKRFQIVHEKIMYTMTDENFDEQIILPLFEESDKVQLLQRITSHATYNLDTSEYHEENIAEYQSKFGDLPEELQLLMDARPLSPESNKEEENSQTLSEINQLGLEYQNNDSEKFNEQMLLMQEKQKEIASDILGVKISNVYIEENWNFPFKDSSKVNIINNENIVPLCNIPEKIPDHLKIIKQTEMFQMISEKYSEDIIMIDISDERYSGGWIHYDFSVTSSDSNETQQMNTHFHLDSCTGEKIPPDVLMCKNQGDEKSRTHTQIKSEINASLKNYDEFCVIEYGDWHQRLNKYQQKIQSGLESKHQKLAEMDSNQQQYSHDEIFVVMMDTWSTGLENNILNHLSSSPYEFDVDNNEELAEYRQKFGELPKELRNLIEQRPLE